MLHVRKCLFAASPLKTCAFFSSKIRPSKKQGGKSGEQRRNAPFHKDFKFGHNPGVENQLKALDLSEQELRDPNVLEDLEQQFWNADKVQNTVDREKYIYDELHGIYQVTRKQFREEKSPNMLLWDEKQEIKALHAQDPETWTVMKLAFSYPATPSIIKKVIKTNWKLRTSAEIEKHDQRVRRNWEALSKGNLSVADEDLKKHLLSFTNRSKIPSHNCKEITIGVADSKSSDPLKNILKEGGVFGNIYNSYKQLKQSGPATSSSYEKIEKNPIDLGLKMLHHQPKHDTFIIPRSAQDVKLRTSNLFTLDEMKERVMQDVAQGKPLADGEENFVKEHKWKKMEPSTYGQLQDPIGNVKKAQFSEGLVMNDKRESSNNGECYDVKGMKVPVLEGTRDENIDKHSSLSIPKENENEIASRYVDIATVGRMQDREDKELLASLRTARVQRNALDDENMVKALKSYTASSSESYPLEIQIPKDLWKKGALYQVKDRFYTDDGEFLFRVPGFSKE